MAQGVLPEKLPRNTSDEIGKISEALNALVDSMRRTAQFANEIGSGNTKADYQLLSDYDVLGKALLQMRNNLNESNLKEEYRNKLLKGEAEASEIARTLQQNVELLSNSLISFICQQIDGVYGAVYILGNDVFQSNTLFLKGSYAINTNSEIKKTFRVGEGLVGQSVKDGLTYYRTGVQMEMPSIEMGLFNSNTKSGCLLILPLIFNSEKVGVIEIAALQELDNQKQQLAFALCKVLSASVYNTRINERTNNLLNEQKDLTSELQVKQRELGQQTEEMKLAQASLKEAYVQLTKQFNEVKLTEKRIQVLMENATEIIAIYNEDGTIRYVSPSVEPILGYKPEELIRKDDNELVVNGLDVVLQRRKELLANPETPITIQFTYKNKFGDEVYIESRGLNMLHDPAINGIIVNARDVTSTVMAERESKIRTEMQALSENSTDIIARINKFGVFFYINPTIKQYTGLEPKQFLNRRITDFPLSPIDLLKDWTSVIGEILSTRRKVKREVEFNSTLGNRTFTITAVPELNSDTNTIDSILIVCHDITERKLIELEIQNKSNKITESITYAKRIQLAILPEENSIKQMFPNSFVIFKPKDVVSGDFVWSFKKDNDLYVAVVDCTGHGVPGALLSLIGYFLLQDITRTESEPALILNRLDKGLTDSLRFNNAETGTRDGMDIAICRINIEKQTLTFAGAHRPLYLQRDSQVLEFKGDKFTIGSMEFFNATSFNQQEIPIYHSDRILLFSDGYADQFGGPEDKKYTAKRIRDVFAQNQASSISKLADLYNNEIELWKGSNRQIDDILMVGIEIQLN
jgi:PAS domain S-box-containing protein